MAGNLSARDDLLPATPADTLLVSLVSLSRDSLDAALDNISSAFPDDNLLIASPDLGPDDRLPPPAAGRRNITLLRNQLSLPPSSGAWSLVAADFFVAHQFALQNGARTILLLGPESDSLGAESLQRLAQDALRNGADLAMPRYTLPPRAGLVNSAILYPLSRALFGAIPRFPLAIDLALSRRMLDKLAAVAQRSTAANQPEALLWPVAEAVAAGFNVTQVDVGPRTLPQTPGLDLNTVLPQVAGSLFAELDAKASAWQRSRIAPAVSVLERTDGTGVSSGDEINSMIDAFRIAYGNLHELWALVLPPQSLLGLKRISAMSHENFLMPDSLWARVVYDFVLAFRLRTINRGHLLGALTPLYLAWAASHILLTGRGTPSESHIETLAAAFETDKSYLVSRWRWPDRFNP